MSRSTKPVDLDRASRRLAKGRWIRSSSLIPMGNSCALSATNTPAAATAWRHSQGEAGRSFSLPPLPRKQQLVTKTTLKGEIVWATGTPWESGVYDDKKKFVPTNVAFHPTDEGFYIAAETVAHRPCINADKNSRGCGSSAARARNTVNFRALRPLGRYAPRQGPDAPHLRSRQCPPRVLQPR